MRGASKASRNSTVSTSATVPVVSSRKSSLGSKLKEYEYDKCGRVVKPGISGGKIQKDRKSVRAEVQVSRCNKVQNVPNGPYTSKDVKRLKRRKGSRERILKWESK